MTTRHTPEIPWTAPRFKGITRPYRRSDVDSLRGSVRVAHTLARDGADKFWKLLKNHALTPALGALNGDQAVEMAAAGLPAVHLAQPTINPYFADTYDMPTAVRAVNRALLRADSAAHARRRHPLDWMLPIVAQADTGLPIFEHVSDLIAAGTAAIVLDDLAPSRRNSHNPKAIVPLSEAIERLTAARLAADVLAVPTVLIARTDAESATCLTSDHDALDRRHMLPGRTPDGKYLYRGGLAAAIDRALALAPYADVLCCEFSDLNPENARRLADAVHAQFPAKLLAFNCSPAFHWRAKLNEDDLACFQRDLAAMGYRFQFISLAGQHTLNLSMYQFAKEYLQHGMTAFSQLQEMEQDMARHFGSAHARPQRGPLPEYDEVVNVVLRPAQLRPELLPPLDTRDYNDDEATERTPMPHLYPSLDAAPRPMAAAAD